MKTRPFIILAFLAHLPFTTFKASAHPGSGIVVDAQGRLYFAEAGDPDARLPGIVWQIDAQGKLTQLKEGGGHWLALDAKKSFSQTNLSRWFEKGVTPWLQSVDTPDAALIQADGQPIVVHGGNLYYAKRNLELTRLSPEGKLTPIAPGFEQTAEKLGGIKGLAFGPDDCLYVACPSAILQVKKDGKVSTMVQPIAVPDCDNDFPPNSPENQSPFSRGLAVDARGTVYLAATGCRSIVKITSDAKISVILRSEPPWSPTGVAVRDQDVYVLEYQHPHSAKREQWLPRVRKIGPDGKVTTLATHPTAQGRPAAP